MKQFKLQNINEDLNLTPQETSDPLPIPSRYSSLRPENSFGDIPPKKNSRSKKQT